MYKPKKIKDSTELIEFIEGNDVYNSMFIDLLQNITETNIYKCNRTDKRLDLISEHISNNSESMLAILNKLTKGDKFSDIKYLSANQINTLIANSMK